MRKITKFRRSVRAISPVISVLLMIAIAVAAALVAYAWVTGYMDFTTTKVGKSIQIQSISTTAVYVQNVGDSKVTLKSCYINGDLDENATTQIDGEELLKSATFTINEFDTANIAAFSGEQITVRIVTTDGLAAEYTETFP
jgi:flagellin-like protein